MGPKSKSPYGAVSEDNLVELARTRSDPTYVLALERTLSQLRAAYALREAELIKAVSLLGLSNPKARILVCGIAERIDKDPFFRSALSHPAKLDVYLEERGEVPTEAQAHTAMAKVLDARELQPELGDELDMHLLMSFPTTDLKPDLRDKSKMEFYPSTDLGQLDGDMDFDTGPPSVEEELAARRKLEREVARVGKRQAKLPGVNVGDMREHDEAAQAKLREETMGKTGDEVRREVKERQAARSLPSDLQRLDGVTHEGRNLKVKKRV